MKIEIPGETLLNIFNAANQLDDDGILIFRDDSVLLKMSDPSESLMFASLIPESAMKSYEKGDTDQLGLDFEKFTDIIPNTEDIIQFEFNSEGMHKIIIRYNDSEYRTRGLDIGGINKPPEKLPTFEYPVIIQHDPDIIYNEFINDCQMVGLKSYIMSPREGMMYLYSRQDDDEVIKRLHWEDFENYQIDWSKGEDKDESNIENALDPNADHGVDTMLSVDLTNDILYWTDTVTTYIDNHMPMKTTFEDEQGIKISWILAPRIPTEGKVSELPDHVIKERGLETA